MEGIEKKLLEEYLEKDLKLKSLFDEHKRLEKRLSKLSKKTFLTSEEEVEERRLKKEKLLGRDEISQILKQHSNSSVEQK